MTTCKCNAHRQALRLAAQQLAAARDSGGSDGALSPQQQLGLDTQPLLHLAEDAGVVAQTGSVAQRLGLSRDCKFSLTLVVRVLNRSSNLCLLYVLPRGECTGKASRKRCTLQTLHWPALTSGHQTNHDLSADAPF